MNDQHSRRTLACTRRPPATILPLATRSADTVAGHWLLARLGKRVLQPGGAQLTTVMLAHSHLADADVVELAPGLGRTAAEIIAHRPRSYLGVERDREAARAVTTIVDGYGRVRSPTRQTPGYPPPAPMW